MARPASQVVQMVMEALGALPPSQAQFDALRKLRIAQAMIVNHGLDVPVVGSSMSAEGAAAVKNSLKVSPGKGKRTDLEANTARDAEEVTDGN